MPVKKKHIVLCAIISMVLLLMNVPCSAWIFDGGVESKLSVAIKNDTSLVWAAAGFAIPSNSYATKFGLAMSRAAEGSIFDVYLTEVVANVPGSNVIASWTLTPSNASPTYNYYMPETPILLNANTGYALVVKSITDESYGALAYSTVGYTSWGSANYGASWNRLVLPLCLRVDGYAVPEPAALCVLLSGIGTLALRRRVKLSV